MAAVNITGVHKWFGTTQVIRGVDVGIADGEFCVLVGPSGCGKSTLLRMIAGLEEITEGEIAIGGKVVKGTSGRQGFARLAKASRCDGIGRAAPARRAAMQPSPTPPR